jgi:cyclase
MLKKRMIFTLLFCDGFFMLSRNFRLQKIGDIKWLQENYDFSHVSYSIDELVVIDISRGKKSIENFSSNLKLLADGCFVPITAGGGIHSVETARHLLRSGADKIIINSELFLKNGFVDQLASQFGQQCIVGSMDLKIDASGNYLVLSNNGSRIEPGSASYWIEVIVNSAVGEIYLNSIDRDGTGQGLDMNLLDNLPENFSKPIIMAGGVGSSVHIIEGLADDRVNAVATANLLNFIGNGLENARKSAFLSGILLPLWDERIFKNIK